MSTYDETKHRRGANPANVGQYSPKDHADAEGVELERAFAPLQLPHQFPQRESIENTYPNAELVERDRSAVVRSQKALNEAIQIANAGRISKIVVDPPTTRKTRSTTATYPGGKLRVSGLQSPVALDIYDGIVLVDAHDENDAPVVTAYNGIVLTRGPILVNAVSRSRVALGDRGVCRASGQAHVVAVGRGAYVEARDLADVDVKMGAYAHLSGRATGLAWKDSLIVASGKTSVIAHDGSEVVIYGDGPSLSADGQVYVTRRTTDFRERR
jgi:co-chaperonin GroES (HSP10)